MLTGKLRTSTSARLFYYLLNCGSCFALDFRQAIFVFITLLNGVKERFGVSTFLSITEIRFRVEMAFNECVLWASRKHLSTITNPNKLVRVGKIPKKHFRYVMLTLRITVPQVHSPISQYLYVTSKLRNYCSAPELTSWSKKERLAHRSP